MRAKPVRRAFQPSCRRATAYRDLSSRSLKEPCGRSRYGMTLHGDVPNADPTGPRLLVVTNMATHYRLPLFERLASIADTTFAFFSDGGEAYWGGRALPDTSSIEAVQLRGA